MCPSSVRAYEREVREGGEPIRMHECRGKRDAHALVGAASREDIQGRDERDDMRGMRDDVNVNA